jgi:hypothetical protein
MTNWQYTDATNTVAFRTFDDGRMESMLASALPEGTTILPFVKSPEQLQAEIVAATQKRLDDFARTRNYDGILSACTYATSTVPKFAAEGQYCVTARDATWASLYTILGEVQAGTRPVPSGYEDIEGDLPALVWPAN